MNDELLSNSCERNGVDQGMHNVWVHTERVKPMHIWWNEDGPIATVQSMKELHRDHFGRLTNTKGGTRTPPLLYACDATDMVVRGECVCDRRGVCCGPPV